MNESCHTQEQLLLCLSVITFFASVLQRAMQKSHVKETIFRKRVLQFFSLQASCKECIVLSMRVLFIVCVHFLQVCWHTYYILCKFHVSRMNVCVHSVQETYTECNNKQQTTTTTCLYTYRHFFFFCIYIYTYVNNYNDMSVRIQTFLPKNVHREWGYAHTQEQMRLFVTPFFASVLHRMSTDISWKECAQRMRTCTSTMPLLKIMHRQ